ncbi:MAG: DNA repair protein RecO [Candidatus Krumholzibacteria bacterium]|nr:DNA repair protein RecO [Candidatus Krumholzibacteria bacterium]
MKPPAVMVQVSEILKDRAVVLKTYDFGESSVVVVALTREHGKVRFLAKGAKRGKSRFFGRLRTGSLVELVFYFREQRELQLLKEISGLGFCRPGGGDLDKLCIFQAGLEIADRSIIGRESDEEMFDLLEGFIIELPSSEDPWSAFLALEIRLLKAVGFYPSTARCNECHRSLAGETLRIEPRSGLVTCGTCSGGGALSLSPASCELLCMLEKGEFRDIEKVELGIEARREIGEFLHHLFLHHIDGYRFPYALRILKGVN